MNYIVGNMLYLEHRPFNVKQSGGVKVVREMIRCCKRDIEKVYREEMSMQYFLSRGKEVWKRRGRSHHKQRRSSLSTGKRS